MAAERPTQDEPYQEAAGTCGAALERLLEPSKILRIKRILTRRFQEGQEDE
jgi:hypothetical protein